MHYLRIAQWQLSFAGGWTATSSLRFIIAMKHQPSLAHPELGPVLKSWPATVPMIGSTGCCSLNVTQNASGREGRLTYFQRFQVALYVSGGPAWGTGASVIAHTAAESQLVASTSMATGSAS